MRLKIFIAVLASAILVFSCEWFTGKHSSAIDLKGKWKLDSIDEHTDSSKISGALALLMVAALHEADTVLMEFDFSKDSVVTHFSKNVADTSWYQFNPSTSMLQVKQANGIDTISVKTVSDSLISFMSEDSTVMFLKKLE